MLYVTEQICAQDAQHLSANQRQMMAGQQRKKNEVTDTATPQHVLHPWSTVNCNSQSIGNLGSDNEKGCFKETREKTQFYSKA